MQKPIITVTENQDFSKIEIELSGGTIILRTKPDGTGVNLLWVGDKGELPDAILALRPGALNSFDFMLVSK